MASLALPSARPWRAMGMRDRPAGCASCARRLCGALCGSGRPPRGGRRRSFVGGERCWWRRVNLYGANVLASPARADAERRAAHAERPAIRMMALAARRELGGGVRQHPGSNNCVEGAYGIARFDRREPVESDEHARSTCGVRELRDRLCGALCGSGRPPRGGRRRSFVGGERRSAAHAAMLAAPRIGAGARRRTTATSARQRERPTRHSPPHGDIDADDICCCGRRPRRAVQLRGARQSMVLKDQQ